MKFNSDGSITETFADGRVKTTKFNPDNTITESLVDKAGSNIKTVNTSFTKDSVIKEVVTK